jgi:RNA polymerase sigma factor (sigma-70 family)
MRDTEFLAAMEKMAPIVSRRFYFLAMQAKVMDERKAFVEDLVSLTMLEALVNSRKEIHRGRSCEELIGMKAKNVWADYWEARANSFDHSDHVNIDVEWVNNIAPQESTYPKLDDALENADPKCSDILSLRLDGYAVNEIASMYESSAGAISMHIQRLRKKLQKRSC